MNTKKDFERAAKIVRGLSRPSYAWTVREAFVVFFASENPRFDADRFRGACGACAMAHVPPTE